MKDSTLAFNNFRWLPPLVVLLALLSSACTSVTIDHYSSGQAALGEDETVVVLGRRFASNYDTEEDLINCVGSTLGRGRSGVNVIPEQEFVDRLYPWFEPRTAPMRVSALQNLVKQEQIAAVMKDYNIRHIIWIDGKTETTDSSGSIGCSIGAGGAGCFGFGTWDQESTYEASIWDYEKQTLLGKVSTDAAGTSYMPALIVPIPIIARVQASACRGMAEQLRAFFTPERTGEVTQQ
ncbi:hypothetical protein ACXYTJ_07470 [Gilvimarinus sp. F26214L]|uniref:hypothetical protein n=1 Tax=Gilvimarinus sp. DZF01 TaxID=3461371 RepID=UPI00404574D0